LILLTAQGLKDIETAKTRWPDVQDNQIKARGLKQVNSGFVTGGMGGINPGQEDFYWVEG
jgi:hypothetical protein